MNDLENISHREVVNKYGIKYLDFRKQLKPNYLVVWRDIVLGYFLLIITLGSHIYIENNFDFSFAKSVTLSVFFAFIAAFWLSYIQLFIHEAAHYNIHSDRKTNDLMANVFIGLILGINIKGYRKTHWKHHLQLGKPDDTENSYFNPLTITYLIKMLTGIHAIFILLNRNKIKNAQDEASLKKQKLSLVLGGLLNLSFLVILFFNSLYFSCVTWILTVVVFYPFFAAIRQILEHRDEKFTGEKLDFFKKEHGKVSRIFKSDLFSFFFGGAGFSRHMIHHWDPQVSYTNLKKVEEYLCDTKLCGEIIEKSKTTYFKTLFNLIEK